MFFSCLTVRKALHCLSLHTQSQPFPHLSEIYLLYSSRIALPRTTNSHRAETHSYACSHIGLMHTSVMAGTHTHTHTDEHRRTLLGPVSVAGTHLCTCFHVLSPGSIKTHLKGILHWELHCFGPALWVSQNKNSFTTGVFVGMSESTGMHWGDIPF